MAAADEILTEATGTGSRLSLRFERRGDRWTQSIDLIQDSRRYALLESVDAGPGAAAVNSTESGWPPSPPLQQLLVEDRGAGGRVALLVGMAGRSHWSMSVEAAPGRAALRFDVACRLGVVPDWLGSVWRLAMPADLEESVGSLPRFELSESRRLLTARFGAGELLVEAAEVAVQTADEVHCEISHLEESSGRLAPSEGRIAVRLGAGRLPRTVRWIYVVEWRKRMLKPNDRPD